MTPWRPLLRSVPAPAGAENSEGVADDAADAALVDQIRRDQPNAAAPFYKRVRPQVDRTIRRLLGPRDVDHQDLAQTAVMELVTGIKRFRGECGLDGWVATVTAHVVWKHLRRRRTERLIFADALLANDVPGKATSGQDAEARDLLGKIVLQLRQMDDRRSWVFALHDVLGFELREVAEILNISESAAQSRLVRGRTELHARVKADPELAGLLSGWEENS